MGTDAHHLTQLLDHATLDRPDHPAVEDERGKTYSYRELHHAADRLATCLHRWGVARGDRVGLHLPKGCEAVAAIHGILRSGAAYVPVDPASPAIRGAGILADAGVKAVVVAAEHAADLRASWPGNGPLPRFVVVGEGRSGPLDASWDRVMADDAPSPLPPPHSTRATSLTSSILRARPASRRA